MRTGWWVFVLLCLEFLRQVHFFISERSAGYHNFWVNTFFGGFERSTHRRISDWSRFRIWRMLTWIFWIAIIAIVTGKIIHTTPILALLRGPQLLWRALPFVLQLAFAFFFIAFQFIGLFRLLSRGGVDVYFPDDIKTRFSDVWGQDHVLERVKENIIFLENPELVEERGGYVPGGLLRQVGHLQPVGQRVIAVEAQERVGVEEDRVDTTDDHQPQAKQRGLDSHRTRPPRSGGRRHSLRNQ